MNGQQENLFRVRSQLAPVVLAFLKERMSTGPSFTANELRAYVAARCPGAPGSPDRVMRALREGGLCSYVVEDRARSRYRVLAVELAAEAA
jgi:hypothetical protein